MNPKDRIDELTRKLTQANYEYYVLDNPTMLDFEYDAALRELDDPGIHQVYARCPVGGGVAYAVQNRLKKAAAFHIVDAEEEA